MYHRIGPIDDFRVNRTGYGKLDLGISLQIAEILARNSKEGPRRGCARCYRADIRRYIQNADLEIGRRSKRSITDNDLKYIGFPEILARCLPGDRPGRGVNSRRVLRLRP